MPAAGILQISPPAINMADLSIVSQTWGDARALRSCGGAFFFFQSERLLLIKNILNGIRGIQLLSNGQSQIRSEYS